MNMRSHIAAIRQPARGNIGCGPPPDELLPELAVTPPGCRSVMQTSEG